MDNLASGGIVHWKVGHPNVSNDIPQMRSNGFQPPFIAGGNQVAYYLGLKSNAVTAHTPTSSCVSHYETIIKKMKRTHK